MSDGNDVGAMDGGDGPSSPKKGSYYPGKYLKSISAKANEKRKQVKAGILGMQQDKMMAKAVDKETKNNTFVDENLSGYVSGVVQPGVTHDKHRKPVAALSVEGLQVEGVTKVGYQVYFVLALETHRDTTERVSQLDKNGCGSWGDTLNFAVTDISSDFIISVYGKPQMLPALKDKFVGKVVFPLSRLYKDLPIKTLASQTSFQFDSWFHIYPLEEGKVHFEPVVKGLLGTGMVRPKESLGKVHLKLRLSLQDGLSVPMCIALNKPFKPVGEFESDEFEAKHLKYGVERIKVLKFSAGVMKTKLLSLRTWKQPLLSGLTLVWYTYLTLLAPTWQYPTLFAILYIFLNFVFPYKEGDGDLSPLIWNDEIEKDPNMPDSVVGKLKKLPVILGGIQKMANKVAFVLERAFNCGNWTDETVTLDFSISVLSMSLVLSAVFAILQLFFYFVIPLNVLLFVLGQLFFFSSHHPEV
mmetsp:Transcript_26789/g.57935  ORF Transcript_26789/g.57935 Transcript_26789/m.57935 type:complete len:469 (-) Transcript_26789:600-2006(-)